MLLRGNFKDSRHRFGKLGDGRPNFISNVLVNQYNRNIITFRECFEGVFNRLYGGCFCIAKLVKRVAGTFAE